MNLFPGRIAVDLDRTLAHYDTWKGPTHIGEPVPAMMKRVERWLDAGTPVVIFTARVWTDGTGARNLEAAQSLLAVQQWCYKHLGCILPVTCIKDPGIMEIWDDRAVQVEPNTGRRVDGQ